MKPVAYDLFPYERPVRPHAPAKVRCVPWVLYAMFILMLLLCGVNAWRITHDHALSEQLSRAGLAVKGETDKLVHELAAASRRKEVADDIRDWLETSPPAQEVIRLLNDEFARSRVTVRSLSITRAEGQPLLTYTIFFALNDKKESLKAVLDTADQISARFGGLGYKTVGVPVSIQDTPNTWKVGQTLSVPRPSQTPAAL